MADRDNYRGYGSPSGRYYENREYESGRGDRSPRDRDERGLFGGGRDDDRYRDRGRDEDRGFFEKAGEEIRSWFGDDDDRSRNRDRDEYRGQPRHQTQDRDRGYGSAGPIAGRSGRDRDFRDDAREPWGGGDRGGQQPYGNAGRDSGGARYGATSGAGLGSSANQYSGGSSGRFEERGGYGGRSHPQDEHYSEWRNQQLSALDRDYDEYRRENRDKFHSEFTNWRGQRQQQRDSVRQVREHMEVVGSDGEPVGTVDKVAGDRIILTKSDQLAGGHHHSIPCSWLQSVDEKVTLNKTGEQARNQWRDEENRRALFESEDQRRNDGPHILDRSFSGTYGS